MRGVTARDVGQSGVKDRPQLATRGAECRAADSGLCGLPERHRGALFPVCRLRSGAGAAVLEDGCSAATLPGRRSECSVCVDGRAAGFHVPERRAWAPDAGLPQLGLAVSWDGLQGLLWRAPFPPASGPSWTWVLGVRLCQVLRT